MRPDQTKPKLRPIRPSFPAANSCLCKWVRSKHTTLSNPWLNVKPWALDISCPNTADGIIEGSEQSNCVVRDTKPGLADMQEHSLLPLFFSPVYSYSVCPLVISLHSSFVSCLTQIPLRLPWPTCLPFSTSLHCHTVFHTVGIVLTLKMSISVYLSWSPNWLVPVPTGLWSVYISSFQGKITHLSRHSHFSSVYLTLCYTFVGQISLLYIKQLLTKNLYVLHFNFNETLFQLIRVSNRRTFSMSSLGERCWMKCNVYQS